MKKILSVGLLFVLFSVVISASSAQAIRIDKQQWFKVSVSGPISAKAGSILSLTVTAQNKDYVVHTLNSLQIIVIDPFNGTRVLGPVVTTPMLDILPDKSGSSKVSLTIPNTEATINKTLAVIITAIDDKSTVRGATGWGFVVN